MTRINQHYIPQFLLRGFSVRLSRKGNKVWVTKREGIPFQTATRNIASEHDFLPNELDRLNSP
ncbi:MAG: DUF4238 domain-containing protein [Alphaproteobacteria bacterium]|nr:DUF4238 domain-containing protein [Alphaproteobacteria bacterium]